MKYVLLLSINVRIPLEQLQTLLILIASWSLNQVRWKVPMICDYLVRVSITTLSLRLCYARLDFDLTIVLHPLISTLKSHGVTKRLPQNA